MAQFGQFLLNHWLLSALLVCTAVLILLEEWRFRSKRPQHLSPQEIVRRMNTTKLTIFDLREKDLYKKGHIIGSEHRPMKNLDSANSLSPPKNGNPILLICAKGLQSNTIATTLKQKGHEVFVLEGGIAAWQEAGLPLIKEK